MSDFMKWLYAHYIKPELEAASPGEYEMHLSLVENNLAPYERRDHEKLVEYVALRSFQLGFRTGRGLCEGCGRVDPELRGARN